MSERFDPDAPEDHSSRNQYVTRKDARIVLIGVPILLAMLYPVWSAMRREAEKTTCKGNLAAISRAIQGYAQVNDGLMPPVFVSGPNGGPFIDNKGRAVSWATLVQDSMNARHSFRCPSATDPEVAKCQHSRDSSKTIELTYGMVVSMSTRSYDRVANPNDTILISETSNNGARGSYNPVPLRDGSDQPVSVDGYLIGYDDSNFEPSLKTRAMTRLAFQNNAKGTYEALLPGRHNVGIYYLTVGGGLGTISPLSALVDRDRDGLTGYWSTR